MDSFWIFLIITAISLIARVLGGNKKGQEERDRRVNEPSTTGQPKTFEELLREIQASKAPQPPSPKPVVTPSYETRPTYTPSTVEDYDDNLEEEEKSLEDTEYTYQKKDNVYDVYEKAKREAFERASLEDTLTLDQTDVRFGQFKEYQKKKKVSSVNPYKHLIRNPESFKKAFVVSEILQRRV